MNTRSPVHDLSYNFYTGAISTEFPNLPQYLRKYHNSLCDMLSNFRLDGNECYPFEELKNDWKKYSKYGYSMALLLTKLKVAHEGGELALSDILQSDKPPAVLEAERYDAEKVKQRYKEIVSHFYENDFL